MQLGYVIHYVESVAQTVVFYEAAFGISVRFINDDGTYAEMETGATALAFAEENFARDNGAFFVANRFGLLPPGIEIAFVTDDVRAAVEKACAAGAHLMQSPKTKPWGQVVAYVRDKNGAIVELCSPPPPPLIA